jgi:hypothetical protein
MLFDTSSIGSGKIVSAATLSLFGTTKANALGDPSIDIVSSSPASNTTLAASDYGNLGSTSFANIAYASWSTSGYNDFSLNAGGISNISLTGVSKFGSRLGWDTANSFTGTWAGASTSALRCNQADASGTANDPKLVVTYSLPAADLTNMWFQNANNPTFENTKVSAY